MKRIVCLRTFVRVGEFLLVGAVILEVLRWARWVLWPPAVLIVLWWLL